MISEQNDEECDSSTGRIEGNEDAMKNHSWLPNNKKDRLISYSKL